jgi:hypothetical protein
MLASMLPSNEIESGEPTPLGSMHESYIDYGSYDSYGVGLTALKPLWRNGLQKALGLQSPSVRIERS